MLIFNKSIFFQEEKKFMKKILLYVIVLTLITSGIGVVGLSRITPTKTMDQTASVGSFNDISAYRYALAMASPPDNMNDGTTDEAERASERNTDYSIGTIIWQYQISGGYDNSPKAIVSLPDINGDNIDDVVIASEDDYIRCFEGGAIGAGQVLWGQTIYAGSVYCQSGLTATQDVNGDGIKDVVVGAAWGGRLIRCLSGSNGQMIWNYDSGGWVYQVNTSYDYNGDGVRDVLACAGAAPNRVYCLNGLTGLLIWEYPLGGPGFSVIGVRDFTGDGIPDVVAGCSNDVETIGYAKGINGATGAQVWSFTTASSSVWALCQIDDVNGDGIDDVAIGDFSGHVYGLNAATGGQLYIYSLGGGVIIIRIALLSDVNGDGHHDILIGHSTQSVVQVLDGYTGGLIWSHPTADQPWNVARTADISGDAIDDAFVGTLYNSNYVYFLNGVDGSELRAPISYGQALDAMAAIPDVVHDGSMEMMAGGRNGKVTCYSGGLNATSSPPSLDANFSGTPTTGAAPLTVQFTDLSTAENTTITSWQWDFNDDGIIDTTEQNPSWIYTSSGTYTVSLTISNGHISDTETKENYITVFPPSGGHIEIGNITGGVLKVNAEILNNGTTTVSSINWSITLDGGFVLLGKTKSGTIPSIPAGGTEVISDKPVFGFGRITITVMAEAPGGDPVTKTATGFLFFFFITIH
jgi:PKD repeat protein